MQQLESRVREVGKRLAYQSALFVFEEIQRKLPKGPYRDSLQLVDVGDGTYAIQAQSTSQKVSDVDAESTVLYVRAKGRRVLRVHPEIGVLARHSPWTMSTLPFFPSRRYAKVISRIVRRSELENILEDREKDKPIWKAELEKLGVRPAVKLVIPPKSLVIPDVAFEALRIEFGLGGKQGRAHWRPALQALAKKGIPSMLSKRSPVLQSVTSFRYPVSLLPVDGVISESDAEKFAEFQKRLNVKIR